MATAIKETPILIGNDAVRFLKQNSSSKNSITKEQFEIMKKNYEKIKSLG